MDSNRASFFGAVAVLIGVAFVLGVQYGERQVDEVEKVTTLINKEGDLLTAQVGNDASEFDFTPYWRVWNTLERKFIPFGTTTAEEIAAEDRVYKSIEGLVQSYNDPYTVFMRPQVAKDFKISTRGSLEGIGAVIGEKDGGIIVVGPLKDSPAEKAGLLPGDKILNIDDNETIGMTVEDAVNLIRGEGGTEVKLHILTTGEKPRDVFITRGTIEIPSTAHAVVEREVPKVTIKPKDEEKPTSEPEPEVEGDTDASDEPIEPSEPAEEEPVETEVKDFYVLRLFSFSQTSINAFERELNDFVDSGSDSLIIDLRGNPGGFIDSAVHIASWFLNAGDVVVREYHGPNKREVLHGAKDRKLLSEDAPKVAVLVDKGSASASEILAGALQEHGVATIVGTNTFGKGSVQELVNINNELALKVTVARWYTPNGVSISQGGLTPDVVVDPTTATSGDPWLDAAIDALTAG
jgi:carboxyl-terminal processing protease